jgi:battenin
MAAAITLQSFVFPASVRLQPMPATHETFARFKAVFGAAFQTSSLISRSLLIVFQWKQLHPIFLLLGVSSGLELMNLLFFIASTSFSLLLLASVVGFATGAIWMTILATAFDYMDNHLSVTDGNICIGMISSGETVGLIIGSLLGAFGEMGYCASDIRSKGRWCVSTR